MFTNFAKLNITDKSAEDAWKAVEEADAEKEVENIRKVCGTPVPSYHQLVMPLSHADLSNRLF